MKDKTTELKNTKFCGRATRQVLLWNFLRLPSTLHLHRVGKITWIGVTKTEVPANKNNFSTSFRTRWPTNTWFPSRLSLFFARASNRRVYSEKAKKFEWKNETGLRKVSDQTGGQVNLRRTVLRCRGKSHPVRFCPVSPCVRRPLSCPSWGQKTVAKACNQSCPQIFGTQFTVYSVPDKKKACWNREPLWVAWKLNIYIYEIRTSHMMCKYKKKNWNETYDEDFDAWTKRSVGVYVLQLHLQRCICFICMHEYRGPRGVVLTRLSKCLSHRSRWSIRATLWFRMAYEEEPRTQRTTLRVWTKASEKDPENTAWIINYQIDGVRKTSL